MWTPRLVYAFIPQWKLALLPHSGIINNAAIWAYLYLFETILSIFGIHVQKWNSWILGVFALTVKVRV